MIPIAKLLYSILKYPLTEYRETVTYRDDYNLWRELAKLQRHFRSEMRHKIDEGGFITRNCIFCQNQKNLEHFMFDLSNFEYVRCKTCGFVFSKYGLNEELFKDLYSATAKDINKLKLVKTVWDEYCMMKKRFGFTNKKLGKPPFIPEMLYNLCPSGKMLDFACGCGWLLDQAKWFYEAEGLDIDPVKRAMAIKTRCKIYNTTIENLDFQERYNLVTMINVIEHLLEPREVLEGIYSKLKLGGYLYIVCPNVESFAMKLFGNKNDIATDAIEHTNYFSVDTLTRLLKETGYKPIMVNAAGCDDVRLRDLYYWYFRRSKFQHRYNPIDNPLLFYFGLYPLHVFIYFCLMVYGKIKCGRTGSNYISGIFRK